MAMTRSQMRRQLYRGGGIASVSRKNFGLGSKFQELKDKTVERVRKIIPNELADVATKAAPFVAPFNPLAAGIMRGVGRLDQRGSLTDALKQGLLTYGGGQAARYLGGADPQWGLRGAGGKMFTTPIGEGGPIARMYEGLKPTKATETIGKSVADTAAMEDAYTKTQGPLSKFLYGRAGDAASQGAIGAGGEFAMGKAFGKGIPAVFAGSTIATMAIQKALGDTGGREPGESLTAFNKRRENTVANYLAYYYKRANKFRIPPEELEQKTAEFVRQNTTEYRAGENQGGRVGLRRGGNGYPDDPGHGEEPLIIPDDADISPFDDWESKIKYKDRLQTDARPIIYEGDMRTRPMAKGGRIKYALGTGLPGIPGVPQMAEDGLEYDMSEHGGFQPLGSKEGKDEIKANLAKNEFVFTADAVRGAGGGDIELGAQKMYDTMKKLEGRVA